MNENDEKLIEEITKELQLNDVGKLNFKYFIRLCRLMGEWKGDLIAFLEGENKG